MVHGRSASKVLHVLRIERPHVLSSSRHDNECDTKDDSEKMERAPSLNIKKAAALQSAAHVAAESCWKLREMNKGRSAALRLNQSDASPPSTHSSHVPFSRYS